MQIEGLSAIVTGGASGLGAATAVALLERGAKVAIIDWDENRGTSYAQALGAVFCHADVSDADEVDVALDRASTENGIARILVNCAGIAPCILTLRTDGVHPIDAFRRTMETNLVGTFICASRFAYRLRALDPIGEERGVIVNTASIAAFDGQFGQVAYAASKSGIVGMTLPLARDLASELIRVITIAPGVFDTPMLGDIPRPSRAQLGEQVPHPARLGQPGEFAQMVEAIIRNPMLNGETIRLDGALRLGPH